MFTIVVNLSALVVVFSIVLLSLVLGSKMDKNLWEKMAYIFSILKGQAIHSSVFKLVTYTEYFN